MFAFGVHSTGVHILQFEGCTYEKLVHSIRSKFERLLAFRVKLKLKVTEPRPQGMMGTRTTTRLSQMYVSSKQSNYVLIITSLAEISIS